MSDVMGLFVNCLEINMIMIILNRQGKVRRPMVYYWKRCITALHIIYILSLINPQQIMQKSRKGIHTISNTLQFDWLHLSWRCNACPYVMAYHNIYESVPFLALMNILWRWWWDNIIYLRYTYRSACLDSVKTYLYYICFLRLEQAF